MVTSSVRVLSLNQRRDVIDKLYKDRDMLFTYCGPRCIVKKSDLIFLVCCGFDEFILVYDTQEDKWLVAPYDEDMDKVSCLLNLACRDGEQFDAVAWSKALSST